MGTEETLKTCFIKRGIYPGYDFPECHQMAEVLSGLGIDVSVIAFSEKKNILNDSVNGVKIIGIPGTGLYSRIVFPLKVLKILKENKFNIIHAFWGKGFLLLPFYGPKSCKWICDIRSGNIYGGLRSYIINLLMRFESLFFDEVITLDENIKDKIFSNKAKRKFTYITMGVNTKLFRKYKVEKLREKLGIAVTDRVGIYVGTFHFMRRLDELIRSFKEAIMQCGNLKLLMAGGGLEEGKLKEYAKELNISDKVIFTGKVPYEKVPDYINISDFAVSYIPIIPAFDVQLPTKTLEYLACDIPVIATATTANRGIVKDGINGLLVKDNAESLAEAIIKLYEKGFELKGASEYNSKITEKYDWGKLVVNSLLPLYKSLLAGKN